LNEQLPVSSLSQHLLSTVMDVLWPRAVARAAVDPCALTRPIWLQLAIVSALVNNASLPLARLLFSA